MAREKTSKAVIKTARINPETSAEEKTALEIINRWEKQGYNFKQIAVDAILQADGKRPEMFTKQGNSGQAIIASMEHLLAQFAQEIIQALQGSGLQAPAQDDDADDGQGTSSFARGFAKSFMQRQQRGLGSDDE